VATGGCVIIRRAWGECKIKSVLLRRRCSLEGKIWCLDKCIFIIENQVEQLFTSRDSLLGEPMFKVEYDDTKRRCKRKTKQRKKGKLSAALAKNSSTELTLLSLRGSKLCITITGTLLLAPLHEGMRFKVAQHTEVPARLSALWVAVSLVAQSILECLTVDASQAGVVGEMVIMFWE
jgi:hypothetical protein